MDQYSSDDDHIPLGSDDEIRDDDIQQPPSQRPTRGATMMLELAQIRTDADRKVVQYNAFGQWIGKNATKMVSNIGTCVRHHIPITYNLWPEVPRELKEKIYACIEHSFVIDHKSKKDILIKAGVSFRQFKSILRTKYIIPFQDMPECLKSPPPVYDHIEQPHWDSFVSTVLSEEFQKLSDLQKERRSKNKYNHRLARKGYANLVEELNKEGKVDIDADRAILWKHARQGKDGEFLNKEVEDIAVKIDKLAKDPKNKNDDILTKALGTPEHSGRVRGVGGLIAPSFFFHKPSPSISKTKVVNDEEKSWKKEKKELMTQYTRMAKQVLEKNDVKNSGEQTPLSDRGSCQLQAPKASTSNEIVDQGKSCDLAIGNIKNIVASGIVYERIKSHEVVYGVPLSPNDVRVLITLVSNFSALLPIPVAGSIETVSNAIGSHVPWPKSLVIVDKEEKERKKIHRELVSLKEKRPKNDVSRLQMPVAVKYMLRFLEDMKDEYLDIPIPKHVFGYDFNFHLMKDSMKQFCMMEELASSVISAYIAYLCESEPIILEQYAFLQPSLISHGSGPEEQRSRFLCNRLREIKNKLLICPYNPENHWMLVVISLKSSTVWSIDSIGHGIRDYVKTIVNTL